MDINSNNYWERRFKSGDWEENEGKEQNRFFYEIAIKNLPQWIIEEIKEKNLDICDMGSAEGDGTEIIHQNFPNPEIFGVDFSENAVKSAKNS